ncbi:MAG: hypothetical protein CVV64_08555 [Candidatus Wallbacteria bacterium HGW-Wallbacteria-1]|jgi:hypothetical protein|uniref:Uncharacterized protein n=1 Tax=Candidatus Wallbacteria bacterium HGW-Wallbacteria-1 TaxID=2013854 RepID=A0A2N1PPY6_9BACT|nr:MAG: hypothetical protein CVV64_08555 [Candidatus Wallbacteria bacterium HGW-Wallbacteria-1]
MSSRKPYAKSIILLIIALTSLLIASRILISHSTLIGNHAIRVMGMDRVSPGSRASFLVQVTSRDRVPLSNADVTMELSDETASFFSRPRLVGKSVTNSAGYATINAVMPDSEGQFEALFTCYSGKGRDWAGFRLTISQKIESLTRAFFSHTGNRKGKIALSSSVFEAFSQRPIKSLPVTVSLFALTGPEDSRSQLPLRTISGTTDSSGVLSTVFPNIPSNADLRALITAPGWKKVFLLHTPEQTGPMQIIAHNNENISASHKSVECQISYQIGETSQSPYLNPANGITCEMLSDGKVIASGITDSRGMVELTAMNTSAAPWKTSRNIMIRARDPLGQFSELKLSSNDQPFLITSAPNGPPLEGAEGSLAIATLYPDGKPAVTKITHPGGVTTTNPSGWGTIPLLRFRESTLPISISDDMGKRLETTISMPLFRGNLQLIPEKISRLARSGDKLRFKIRRLPANELITRNLRQSSTFNQEGKSPAQPPQPLKSVNETVVKQFDSSPTHQRLTGTDAENSQNISSNGADQKLPVLTGLMKGDTPVFMSLTTGETLEIDTSLYAISGPCTVFAMEMDKKWPPEPGNQSIMIPIFLDRKGLNLSLNPNLKNDTFIARPLSETGKNVLASLFGVWTAGIQKITDSGFPQDPAAISWEDLKIPASMKPLLSTPWATRIPGEVKTRTDETLFDSSMWNWLEQGRHKKWFSGAGELNPVSESRFRFARKLHLSYLFTALLALVCCCGFLTTVAAVASAINYRQKGPLEIAPRTNTFLARIPFATILFTLHLLILSSSFHQGWSGYLNLFLMLATFTGLVMTLLPHLDDSDPYQPVPAIFSFSAVTALFCASLASYLAGVHGAFGAGPFPWIIQHIAILTLAFFPMMLSIFADAASGDGPSAFREVLTGITATLILLISLYSSDSSFSAMMARAPGETLEKEATLKTSETQLISQHLKVAAVDGFLKTTYDGLQQSVVMERELHNSSDPFIFSSNISRGSALVTARTPSGAATLSRISLKPREGPEIHILPPERITAGMAGCSLMQIHNPSEKNLALTMGIRSSISGFHDSDREPWNFLLAPGRSISFTRQFTHDSPGTGTLSTWLKWDKGSWNLDQPFYVPSRARLVFSFGILGKVDSSGWVSLETPQEMDFLRNLYNDRNSKLRFSVTAHSSMKNFLSTSGKYLQIPRNSEETFQHDAEIPDFIETCSTIFISSLTDSGITGNTLTAAAGEMAMKLWPQAFNGKSTTPRKSLSSTLSEPIAAAILLSVNPDTVRLAATIASQALLAVPTLPVRDDFSDPGHARRVIAEKILQLHLLGQCAKLLCNVHDRREAERTLSLARAVGNNIGSDTTLILSLILQRILRAEINGTDNPLELLLENRKGDGGIIEKILLKRLDAREEAGITDPPGSPWDITSSLPGNRWLTGSGLLLLALNPSPTLKADHMNNAARETISRIAPSGRSPLDPALALGAAGLTRYLTMISSSGSALSQNDGQGPVISLQSIPSIRMQPVFPAPASSSSQSLSLAESRRKPQLPQSRSALESMDFSAVTPNLTTFEKSIRIGPFPDLPQNFPILFSIETLLETSHIHPSPNDASPILINKATTHRNGSWNNARLNLSFGPSISGLPPKFEMLMISLPQTMLCRSASVQDLSGLWKAHLGNRGTLQRSHSGNIAVSVSRNHLTGGNVELSGAVFESSGKALVEAWFTGNRGGTWIYRLPIQWNCGADGSPDKTE